MTRIANLSTLPKYFRWEFIKNLNFNIEEWIKEKEYIWDSDNCGEYIKFWVIVSNGEPKFYKSYHIWNWENWDTEESRLENFFEITEVRRQDLDKYAKENLKFVV